MLSKHLSELPDVPKEIFSPANIVSPEIIKKILIKYPYLSVFGDMYESFAALASVHNASVEKFIRRLVFC